MNFNRLYIFDDTRDKRHRLPEIIDELNKRLVTSGIQIIDGFNGKAEEAMLDAKKIIAASKDQEGLLLIDLHMPQEELLDARDAIYSLLKQEGRPDILEKAQLIHEVLGQQSGFKYAAMILALCFINKTRCRIISTADESFSSKATFDFYEDNQWCSRIRYPSGLQDSITSAVNEIEKIYLADSFIDWDEFILRAMTWSHEFCDNNGPEKDLRRFLQMDQVEFDSCFVNEKGELLQSVKEAMKSIGGVGDGRPLQLHGAWLIGLGLYRDFFSDNQQWQEVWRANHFINVSFNGGKSANLFAGRQQNVTCRRTTLECLKEFYESVFINRDSEKASPLLKVELFVDQLSFYFDFPFKGLQKTLMDHLRHSRGEQGFENEHNVAKAIKNLWVSCSLSESSLSGIIQPAAVTARIWNATNTEIRFGG